MIEIKRNRLLTTIKHEGYVAGIKTKLFDEITGVNNFEYVKHLEKPHNKKKTNVVDVTSRSRYMGGIDMPDDEIIHDVSNTKIVVNDQEVAFDKILESWDLTYSMFQSAIKSTSFVCIKEESRFTVERYLSFIKDLIYQNFSMLTSTKKTIDVNYSSLFLVKRKPRLEELTPYGNILSGIPKKGLFLNESVHNYGSYCPNFDFTKRDPSQFIGTINVINDICFHLSFFNDDDEWFLKEITIEEIFKLFDECQEYIEIKGKDIYSNTIFWDELLKILLSGYQRGSISKTITLENAHKQTKLFQYDELVPKPLYLLRKQLGKYGITKTLKWPEDAV